MVLARRNRVPRRAVNPYVLRPIEGSEPASTAASRHGPQGPFRDPRMRRSLATPLLLLLACLATDVGAQILDDTLVPRGQLRLQAHPVFSSWDARFGRAPDGTEGREPLGDDLTDTNAAALFGGLPSLVANVESMTGSVGYAPTLGPAYGRIAQDVTRIEFGGQMGVLDWLTVGVVVPWTQTRTAVDLVFQPDTLVQADLGINPRVSNGTAVDGYLLGLGSAALAAQTNATTVCAMGAGPACTSAQALSARAASLSDAAMGAYAASPFFPLAGSAAATSMASTSSALEADLLAAGLASIGAPMVFATSGVSEDDLASLSATSGAGVEATALRPRRGLWAAGDIEVSALVRVLERNRSVDDGAFGYRLTAGVLVRLPTGTPEDPDILLDLGTGEAQQDIEGRIIGSVSTGPFAISAGARYGVQQSATLTKRVSPLEVALPPLTSRAAVRITPGSYVAFEAVPSLGLTDELSLSGHWRHFQKRRDEYALVDPALSLDATVLAIESGVKLTQVGAGLRYSTVRKWQDGIASRPLEAHVRLIYSVAGGGGHTPVASRVEAGLRLFKRFWGPEPTR